MNNNPENSEGFKQNSPDFENQERGLINPEELLSSEEIEWCKKEADLENIDRWLEHVIRMKYDMDYQKRGDKTGYSQKSVDKSKQIYWENTDYFLFEENKTLGDAWILASDSKEKFKIIQDGWPQAIIAQSPRWETSVDEHKNLGTSNDMQWPFFGSTEHMIPPIIAYWKTTLVGGGPIIEDRDNSSNNMISLDTLVAKANHGEGREFDYLSKPNDKEEAKKMIRLSNGKEISVITGIVVIGEVLREFKLPIYSNVVTKIKLKEFSDKEIEEYLRDHLNESLNSCGGIDYTGAGARFIEKIEGSVDNLKGAPKEEIHKTMAKLHLIQQEIMRQLREKEENGKQTKLTSDI